MGQSLENGGFLDLTVFLAISVFTGFDFLSTFYSKIVTMVALIIAILIGLVALGIFELIAGLIHLTLALTWHFGGFLLFVVILALIIHAFDRR